MTPFETFQLYRALKFHFHTDYYDYHKSKGRVKGFSEAKFAASHYRPWAEKLTKKYKERVGNFLLANLSNNNAYITDLVSDECEKIYNRWDHRRVSRSYRLAQDLKKLSDNLDDELRVVDGDLPEIIGKSIRGDIDTETLLIIMRITNCLPAWDEAMKSNIVWTKTKRREYVKYLPFIKIKPQYLTIFLAKYPKV